MDFLQTHGVQLDFSTIPVNIDICKVSDVTAAPDATTMAIYKAEQADKIKRCPIAIAEDVNDVVDECAISWFNQESVIELPHSTNVSLKPLLQQYQHLFRCSPGKTNLAQH